MNLFSCENCLMIIISLCKGATKTVSLIELTISHIVRYMVETTSYFSLSRLGKAFEIILDKYNSAQML